jgi:glycosyltransferase involved in cell wall biosynthesis
MNPARAPRIVHLTTVHARDDVRIFRKECVSLARAGYEVVQVVGDGQGDAMVQGVRIVDIGPRPTGRLARMLRQPRAAARAVGRERPDLLHLHDPELLPLGVEFAGRGVRVVYDAHEDVPRQILTKQWIPAPLRSGVWHVFEHYENRQVRRLAAVCAATPHIARRFESVARLAASVCNYPMSEELGPAAVPLPRERSVCYAGGLMRTRGLLQMIRAVALLPDVRLVLCGRFEDAATEREARAEPGWTRVAWLGQVDREMVRDVLARSSAGLVTLKPMPSYVDSLPIKMFEYMSARLPVIASNFPLWKDIVERHACGICVDPEDPAAIAAAIASLIDSPDRVDALGRAGRAAVLAEFNWPRAERQLLDLYARLLEDPQGRS